jgi:hypothetical protein
MTNDHGVVAAFFHPQHRHISEHYTVEVTTFTGMIVRNHQLDQLDCPLYYRGYCPLYYHGYYCPIIYHASCPLLLSRMLSPLVPRILF